MKPNDVAPRAKRSPWWREPMLWLVIAGPVTVILAGIATAVIAWSGAERSLAEPTAASAATTAGLQPALKARNHAATPR